MYNILSYGLEKSQNTQEGEVKFSTNTSNEMLTGLDSNNVDSLTVPLCTAT